MLRAALIGLGKVAERIHLPAIAQSGAFQLVAACDRDAGRREQMSRVFRLGATYDEPGAMLAQERPDVVIIGTPPHLHLAHCLLALGHGAHVFCEKPFVETPAEAQQVLDAALAANRLVLVNNQYRYMAMYREPARRLAAGEFGRPFLVQAWQQMYHPPSNETNWRADLVRSTLFEFGTHALDLLCLFFDATPVAVTVDMPHPEPGISADVVVAMLLRFPDERVATVVLNRLSHAPQRYFEMRVDAARASLRLSLGGLARASLDWSPALGRPIGRMSLVKGGEARLEQGGRSRVIARETRTAFASATAFHLKEFAARLAAGDLDQRALRHQLTLIRVVDAGYESARTGHTIRITE